MRPRSTQPPVSHDPRAAATFPRVLLHAESVQSNGAHIYACARAEAHKLTLLKSEVADAYDASFREELARPLNSIAASESVGFIAAPTPPDRQQQLLTGAAPGFRRHRFAPFRTAWLQDGNRVGDVAT